MKRELKFRIWDIVNQEFSYPLSKEFLIGLNGLVYDGNGSLYDESHIIQQWTGITDKNGTEIYEGDILSVTFGKKGSHFDPFGEVKQEIVWKNGAYYFNNELLAWYENSAEIVGNIFEKST